MACMMPIKIPLGLFRVWHFFLCLFHVHKRSETTKTKTINEKWWFPVFVWFVFVPHIKLASKTSRNDYLLHIYPFFGHFFFVIWYGSKFCAFIVMCLFFLCAAHTTWSMPPIIIRIQSMLAISANLITATLSALQRPQSCTLGLSEGSL